MDYMEDSKMEVLNYLRKQKVDIAALDEAVIDEMAYRYYKNYYSYEMSKRLRIWHGRNGNRSVMNHAHYNNQNSLRRAVRSRPGCAGFCQKT